MRIPRQPGDLVEYLYETSVKPERLFDLIEEWDARIQTSDPEISVRLAGYCDAPFVRHVERALEILDELNTFEFGRLDDLLAGITTASMVLTDRGAVVAANEPARTTFGLFPGGSIRRMPLAGPDLDGFADRLAAVALGPEIRDDVVQLDLLGRDRPVLMHLRTLGIGRVQRHALAVSTEHLWQDAAGGVLARVFGLTVAEISLVRQLSFGNTVQEISRTTARSEGTVRSQLHAVLGKTGTRSQGELIRLATMLLQAVAFDPGQVRSTGQGGALSWDRRPKHIRLTDGRRLAVLQYGDPAGRPVLWLQSGIGYFQPTPSGERELIRRGLRVVVPLRAGYATSDPAPPGRDILDVAVSDLAELLEKAGIARCPVVTTTHDIRIALMLAQNVPERVEHIVAIACVFPILNMEQFRRLNTIGRFYTATVRYAPHMLRFILRAWHADTRRRGLHASIRQVYRDTPADARAFADPEIAEATIAAFALTYAAGATAQAAFCAEAVRFHQPWPAGLGAVTSPVTLIHGEQDGNGSYETALDYCAIYPAWRCVGFTDEGELVALARWNDVLDVIEDSGTPALVASPTAP